jgi:tetratricopeptide (TPR) repeat protein
MRPLLLLCCLALQQTSFEELARQAGANVDTNPALAATLFQKALALQPSWGEGWLYLGGSLYRLEHYSEAIQAFDKGISLAPPMGTSWAFRGLCEFELKHFDKALEDFQKGESVGLGANRQFESVVRQHAALLYIRLSFFDQAMAQLEPLSNYGDNSQGVVEAAGLCALTLAQWPDELSQPKRAVVDLAGKAQWASMSRQPAEAEVAYRELLATYPQEPGVHYAHGLYLLEADQDAALAEFEQELKTNPAHWPSLVVSASLENKRGESQRAMQLARTALKTVPASYLWLCHAEIGRSFLATHAPEKAIPEFEAAAKQVPANPQMHFYLEQAYRLAGNEDGARKEKAEFVRLSGAN